MKVFSFFMVKYQFEYVEVIVVWIQYTNCHKNVPCMISETVSIYIVQFFIKASVFHHVGLSWMIQTNYQIYYSVHEPFPCWCTGGPWYNKTIVQLCWPFFEEFFVTALQYRSELIYMSYIHTTYYMKKILIK